MSFTEAVESVYRNYFNFSGRAGRSEYWWFQLFFILMYVGLAVAYAVLPRGADSLLLIAWIGWLLATVIPQVAVVVRRLHDSGKSGWWFLIAFVPFGSLVLLVLMIIDSDHYPNRWGPPPPYVRPPPVFYPQQPGYGYPPGPPSNPNGGQSPGGYQSGYPPQPGIATPAAHPLSENQPPPDRRA